MEYKIILVGGLWAELLAMTLKTIVPHLKWVLQIKNTDIYSIFKNERKKGAEWDFVDHNR